MHKSTYVRLVYTRVRYRAHASFIIETSNEKYILYFLRATCVVHIMYDRKAFLELFIVNIFQSVDQNLDNYDTRII
jgi:hypothetical protein